MVKFSLDLDAVFRKQWLWLGTLKFAAFIAIGIRKLLAPLFWISSWKRVQKIPKIDDKIYKIPAVKLAELIRNKKISSEHIVRKYIERINKVNPVINAVVQNRFEESLLEASKVDQFLKQTTLNVEEIERVYPLLGVPLTIKESCKLKGLSFSVGVNTRKGMIAEDDGEAVKRIKSAGGIPLLVSNTPEVCFGLESNNLITGKCKNPYNTNHTVGGSSGGEGALLGSACSILSLGSDLACSIRLPALYNGVFGHKPTSNLVPNHDHYPTIDDEDFMTFLTLGPMARYAEDLRLLLKVIANPTIDLNEKVNLKDVTIFYTEELGNLFYVRNVQDEIKVSIRKCAQHLKNRFNCKVNRTKLFDLNDCFDMCLDLFFGVKNKPDLLRDQNNPSKRYGFISEISKLPFGRSTLYVNTLAYGLMSKLHSALAVHSKGYYRDYRDELQRKLISSLGPNGIILIPTMPDAAFQHHESIFHAGSLIYCMLFNILGFPATHVPLGLNKKGLPIGIQVVACPKRDALCLSVAEELDSRFGGWVPPPS